MLLQVVIVGAFALTLLLAIFSYEWCLVYCCIVVVAGIAFLQVKPARMICRNYAAFTIQDTYVGVK
jgi:hypothetical protein